MEPLMRPGEHPATTLGRLADDPQIIARIAFAIETLEQGHDPVGAMVALAARVGLARSADVLEQWSENGVPMGPGGI